MGKKRKRDRQIVHDLIFRCNELHSQRSCTNGDGCAWSAESGCIPQLENLKQIAPANLVRFALPSVVGTLKIHEHGDKGIAILKTAIGKFEIGVPTSLRLLFDDTDPAVFKLKLSKPPSLQKNTVVILDGLKTEKYNRMLGEIQSVDENDRRVHVKLRPAEEQAFTLNYAYLYSGGSGRMKDKLRVPESKVFQYPTELELDLSLLVGKVTGTTGGDVKLELLPLNSDRTVDDDSLKNFSTHSMFNGTVARTEVRIVETQY